MIRERERLPVLERNRTRGDGGGDAADKSDEDKMGLSADDVSLAQWLLAQRQRLAAGSAAAASGAGGVGGLFRGREESEQAIIRELFGRGAYEDVGPAAARGGAGGTLWLGDARTRDSQVCWCRDTSVPAVMRHAWCCCAQRALTAHRVHLDSASHRMHLPKP